MVTGTNGKSTTCKIISHVLKKNNFKILLGGNIGTPILNLKIKKNSYIISGTGDVLEPEGNVIGIGSGGNYALAAGKVLMESNISAEEVAKKAIKVAADICVFTNENVKIEKI